ncbi:pyridoxamine 5'-phosphate oxidase family protein [Alkalilacustris brevis]|uniref:pyridoxamine 5'-phosphate oxidase family protein n=1 Tax=Alkalilacustris brevis TaxID=2026338 RepID=UPI000E0DF4DA|nr:pyridoxamine 5'-phosphate oxidase family protein [Alkalilacustris brevis]
MKRIESAAALDALYDTPREAARAKVTPRLTPAYRAWVERSRFCILSTAGPEGIDSSPRGDDRPVVRVQDAATLLLPDWRGNDRIDSLRNIVADGRASLMFMVPGSNNVLRANGRAKITADEALLASFARGDRQPRSVLIFTITEVYFQCARAMMRAGLWNGQDDSTGLPSAGEMLRQAAEGDFDAEGYDTAWAARATKTMW